MEILTENDTHMNFCWEKLGDITAGRPNLGEEVPVKIYRILEYALYDVLSHTYGVDEARELVRAAGYKAGLEFSAHVLDLTLNTEDFMADLAQKIWGLKIGILRIEHLDWKTGAFTVTVSEDLDCSGLPVTGETVCTYDEGLLSGIFESYTKQRYVVREVDCWASGAKTCRFKGRPEKRQEQKKYGSE